ncbi:MAG: hypothetical protein KGI10_09125, partial [Thaumarchaeota archaeon]|nr:hypothetical protein [Nitrososphaerota archaeon]
MQTTLDRILSKERIRSNGKSISVIADPDNELSSNIKLLNLESYKTTSTISSNFHYGNNQYVSQQILSITYGIENNFSFLENKIITYHQKIEQDWNDVKPIVEKTTDPQNPIFLVLLVPLSGYLLIRSEDVKLKISNPNRILSVCFIVILISSSVVTPVSMSPVFLKSAYAETTNDLQPNPNPLGGSGQHVDSSLSFNQFSNATQSLSFNQFSNATQSLSFNQFSNATQSLSFNQFSNATAVIPTKSWNFTSSSLKSITGEAQMDDSTNKTSLNLDGNGYLKENVATTQNLSALTLSAWVKPDYSQGSSQFTVISKENTFILAINNNIQPSKKAVFSIFDGIKWNTVVSNSTIPEGWTHIAATYDGSSIGIYVNGKQESQIPLAGVPRISVNGKIINQTVGTLSSNSDVVIGAYLNTLRTQSSNLFSGSIQDVKLYGSPLEPSQIMKLYDTNPLVQQPNTLPNSLVLEPNSLNATSLTLTPNLISNTTSLFSNSTAMVNSTAVNDTGIPVTPSITSVKKGYLITENPEFQFEYFTKQDLKKFKKDTTESLGTIQHDKWIGKNTAISAELVDPNGKSIPININFEKLREGKFDIKLSSLRQNHPGMYKIKVTLVKDGKTYTNEQSFAWGLVTVNTAKSIYKPGETADFIIAVLDNTGSSVCDSNIVMKITDPTSQNTVLSTVNGITIGECGLYNAHYVTGSEGNYTIDISATSSSGVSHFSTYFTVAKKFDYDVIRTTDTKIDPFNSPNNFNVKINLQSFVDSGPVVIKEYIPSVLNVTTDGTVTKVGDTKIITWQRNLDASNNTLVSYNYSVPLIQPELYALGKVEVYKNDVLRFTEARNWFVAVDAGTVNLTITATRITNDANILGTALVATISPACASSTVTKSGLGTTITGCAKNTLFTITWELASSLDNLAFQSSSGTQTTTDTINTPPTKSTTSYTSSASTAQSITATFVLQASVTLPETLSTSDSTSTFKKTGIELSETLSTSDSTSTFSKSKNINLPETLSTSDSTSTFSKSRNLSLPETLSSSDVLTKGRSVTLPETLSSSDVLTKGRSVTLPETLSSSDVLTKGRSVTLPETLSTSDSTSTFHQSIIQSLPETLSSSDVLTKGRSVTLPETLSTSDSTSTFSKSKNINLPETLSSSDVLTKGRSVTLPETLSTSDSTSTFHQSIIQSLPETLSLSDSTSTFSKSKTQSLPETLSTSDQLTLKQSVSVTLPETLSTSDQLTPLKSVSVTLPETLSTSDQLTPLKSVSVTLP